MVEITVDTERLVEEIARRTGKTPDEVVREAVEPKARALGLLNRKPSDEERRRMIAKATEIAIRCSSLPVLDDRSADEILGYDEFGIPR